MKQLKKLLSVMLSMTVLAGLANSGLAIRADDGSTRPKKLSTIMSEWDSRISSEKNKFPGDAFWNHTSAGGTNDQFTYTPCNHRTNERCYCNSIQPKLAIYDTHEECKTSYDVSKSTNPNGTDTILSWDQCPGFARKVAEDIWGTKKFVRYYINNGNINYSAGGLKAYEPQKGDQVRLFTDSDKEIQGHSLFITNIIGNQIYIADCNSDLYTCKIRWDADEVSIYGKRDEKTGEFNVIGTETITKDFLRKNAIFIERPYIQGDFNLNGKIDQQDYACFNDTYLSTGNKKDNYSYEEYDVDGDLEIDEYDLNQLGRYANSSTVDGYIYGTGSSVKYLSRNQILSNSFLYNNGIYKSLDSNTAAFIGPFNKNSTSFTVDSYVTNSADSKTYKVTKIGDTWDRGPGMSLLAPLTTLKVPDTVQTIGQFSFGINEAALTNLTFLGTSCLSNIEPYAFFNCSKLTSITLPASVQNIGQYAFQNCNALTNITVAGDASGNCKLTNVANCAFFNCPKLAKVTIANNLQKCIFLGTNSNVFDFTNDEDKKIQLILPNTNKVQGILYMNGSDVTAFYNSGTPSLTIYAGNYKITGRNSDMTGQIGYKTSTSLQKITPIK